MVTEIMLAVAQGAQVNSIHKLEQHGEGFTPLSMAILRNSPTIVELLVLNGASIRAHEEEVRGWSAIHLAAFLDHAHVLQILLHHCRGIRSRMDEFMDMMGLSPTEIAREYGSDKALKVLIGEICESPWSLSNLYNGNTSYSPCTRRPFPASFGVFDSHWRRVEAASLNDDTYLAAINEDYKKDFTNSANSNNDSSTTNESTNTCSNGANTRNNSNDNSNSNNSFSNTSFSSHHNSSNNGAKKSSSFTLRKKGTSILNFKTFLKKAQ